MSEVKKYIAYLGCITNMDSMASGGNSLVLDSSNRTLPFIDLVGFSTRLNNNLAPSAYLRLDELIKKLWGAR